jgi:gas vesicle protein
VSIDGRGAVNEPIRAEVDQCVISPLELWFFCRLVRLSPETLFLFYALGHVYQGIAMEGVVSENDVPVGMDAELNKELAETWNDMKQRLKALAELSQGEQYDENLTADQVKENLNAIQTGRRRKGEKWHTLKKTIGATLDIIAKVGGMVADAASQVNAVNSPNDSASNSFNAGFRPGWTMLQRSQFCHQRVQGLPKYI